jgi:ABC-type sugar transport system permease subunit
MFITPKLLLFTVFLVVPLIWTTINSFQQGAILGSEHFVGTQNFRQVVSDPEFPTALKNSLYYAVLVIPITITIAVCLAGLLNRKIRFRPLFTLLLIVPSVTSAVAASVMWDYMTQTNGGLFNTILGIFNLGPVDWLGTPSLIIPLFVSLEVWRAVGFYTVLFLAAMQGIPRTIYDAAAVDGAVGIRAFARVTVPLLRPTMMFACIMATIWNLQLFDTPFVLTNGGPGFSSTTMVLYVYDQAFSYNDMGLAAAMSIVLLGIILVFSLLQYRLFRRELEF